MPCSFVPIFGLAAFLEIATNAKIGVYGWISLSGRRGHGDATDPRPPQETLVGLLPRMALNRPRSSHISVYGWTLVDLMPWTASN
jgi:hypothetical protein